MSHERNLPLHGVAHISCSGACSCKLGSELCAGSGGRGNRCIFDTLKNGSTVTVVNWVKLTVAETKGGAKKSTSCPVNTCAVGVRASKVDGDRNRLVLRAAIVGVDDYRTADRPPDVRRRQRRD